MITLELVEYIKSQLNKNISKDLVVSNLLEAGWHIEDIQEGFLKLEPIKISGMDEVKKSVDIYREPADDGDPIALKEEVKQDVVNKDPLSNLKIWVPSNIQPIVLNNDPVEEIKILEPEPEKPKSKLDEIKDIVEKEMAAAATSPDVSTVVTPIISAIPEVEKEFKLIIPEEIKKDEKIEFSTSKELEPYNLEIKGEEQTIPFVVNQVAVPELKPIAPSTPITDFISPSANAPMASSIPITDFISPSANSPINIIPVQTSISPLKEEINIGAVAIPTIEPFIPNIEPKVSIPVTPIIPFTPHTTSTPSLNTMSDMAPKSAMLSSYSRDLLSMTKKEDEEVIASPIKKKKILKISILVVASIIVAGMIFAFVEGYLKIPGSNFSFFVVKKDPKVVLLNSVTNIAKLKSFKVDTSINISSPALSNITTGLSSGQVVSSNEKDSVSAEIKGIVNHIGDRTVFDYGLVAKSSLLDEDIKSDLKYDGVNQLFVSVPKLNQLIGKDAPTPVIVATDPNKLGLLVPELSPGVQDLIKKVDIYNIATSGIPPYVQNQIFSTLKEFIGTLEYVPKGEETIHGVETYHYEMTATRVATKKMLTSLVLLFSIQLTDEQKKNLDEGLGASSISSFEVWTGKNDANLYQIKFTLNTPLSRVLWLNDSGIAGNEVKLDWMTTFYDLDVANSIAMPSDSISMDEFINNIRNTKIKNIISTFKPETILFKNAVGSYGKKSDASGSCTAPLSGSLFSPLGQSKGADTAISSISSSISSLLILTKGEGSCYSTSKAWALSAPLYSTPASYYCTDSAGNTTILSGSISGSDCSAPLTVATDVAPTAPVVPSPAVSTTTPVTPATTSAKVIPTVKPAAAPINVNPPTTPFPTTPTTTTSTKTTTTLPALSN